MNDTNNKSTNESSNNMSLGTIQSQNTNASSVKNIQDMQVVNTNQTNAALENSNQVSMNVNNQENINKEPVNQENNNDVYIDNNGNEITGKVEFPFTAIVIGIVIVLIVLGYYFLHLTPTRIFDEAIEDIFGRIKTFGIGLTQPEEDTLNVSIDGKMHTKGYDIEQMEDIAFLDNFIINSTLGVDLKKLNIRLGLVTDIKETTGMKYPSNVSIGADYIDEKFYIELFEKIINFQTSSDLENKLKIDYSRINDLILILEEMKNLCVDITDNKFLSKNLASKKINGQTAYGIRAHIVLEEEQIKDIYYEGFSRLLENEDIINRWANLFAISNDEAIEMLEKLYNKEVKTKYIEINLYMNLANTDLISLEVTVDNFYFEISSLNGFYYIDFKYIDDEGFELVDAQADVDTYNQTVDGVIKVNTTAGNVKMTFNYEPGLEVSQYEKKDGKLNIEFYNDNNEKPFVTINCTLNIKYNDKVNFIDTSNSIGITQIDDKDFKDIITLTKKIPYEMGFVGKKLLLNKLPSNVADEVVNKYTLIIEEYIENEIVNMIDYSLSNLSKDEISQLVSSPENINEFISKLEFLSKNNKNKVMLMINNLIDKVSN